MAANVQAGKTNSQSVGETSNVEQTITRPVARRDVVQSNDDSKVKSDSIEKVVVNEVPVWVILLLVLGWLLPSPGEMMRVITRPFSKRS